MSTIHTILSKIDRAKLEKVCRKRGILAVYLFGSQVDGFADAMSDIDLGILFLKEKDLSSPGTIYATLFNDFSELFEGLMMGLDIVLLQRAPLLVAANAVRGELLYSADDEERFDFVERILTRAMDFRPWVERYYKDLLHSIREG